MPGNTFGTLLKLTTFGESHGTALGAVIDGCPAGIKLTEKDFAKDLARRRPSSGNPASTTRTEPDQPEILSGIFDGITTGMPIAVIVRNTNQRSQDYAMLKDVFRPGHADFTYALKYGIRDYRGGGRSSGRETLSRVIGGTVAKKILAFYKQKTEIFGYATQIGPIKGLKIDRTHIEKNPLRAADPEKSAAMLAHVIQCKESGDSVGGIIKIQIMNPPQGLGEPVFDKLQADLAKALFSIATIKGVEIGDGFDVAAHKGSENNDRFTLQKGKIVPATNHAGGIMGGISTGAPIIIRCAVKPPSSITKEQKTATTSGKEKIIKVEGRHDACLVPRVIPVAEAMCALVITDHYLRQRVL